MRFSNSRFFINQWNPPVPLKKGFKYFFIFVKISPSYLIFFLISPRSDTPGNLSPRVTHPTSQSLRVTNLASQSPRGFQPQWDNLPGSQTWRVNLPGVSNPGESNDKIWTAISMGSYTLTSQSPWGLIPWQVNLREVANYGVSHPGESVFQYADFHKLLTWGVLISFFFMQKELFVTFSKNKVLIQKIFFWQCTRRGRDREKMAKQIDR